MLNIAELNEDSGLTAEDVRALEAKTKREARNYAKELLRKFYVLKKYRNGNAEMEFVFTKGGYDESVGKQAARGNSVADFGRMLSCMDSIVENAVPVQSHTDAYADTPRADSMLERVYVLMSAFSEGERRLSNWR